MRDFGKISTSIWQSKKFMGLKSDDLRMFYLYLHTCPHVNSIGCFRLPVGYVMADLKWSDRATNSAIDALCKAQLVRWDNQEQIILISNFLAESPITNIKHGAGACKLALSLPECELKHCIIDELLADKYAGGVSEWKGYDRPIHTPIDTTETETEPERETEPETDITIAETSDVTVIEPFDYFWEQYPRQRRGNKAKAKSAYLRALKEHRATDEAIADGLQRYIHSAEVANGYAKGAEAWLNDDRWKSDYTTQPQQGGGQGAEIKAEMQRMADELAEKDQGL